METRNFSAGNFDLGQIEESGQCFRWRKIREGEYLIPYRDMLLKITQKGSLFEADAPKDAWEKIWRKYFDLETDYSDIACKIREQGDAHLCECLDAGSGIRILRQDLWEVIVSFMISQNNNIARIKKTVEKLCEIGGRRFDCDEKIFAFPKPSDIMPKDFYSPALGLGYRAEYLDELFKFVLRYPDWTDYLKKLSYEDARKVLMERKGIGPKVADCICLFGLHHIDAFPVDTHVKQLMAKYYPKGINLTPFEGYKGVIQQYLFYFEIKKPTR